MSILIPALQNRQSGYQLKPELMQQLLSALFQRAVIEDDPAWKLACMGAISTMYERYPEQFKGRAPTKQSTYSCQCSHSINGSPAHLMCVDCVVIRAADYSVLRLPAPASARRAHLAGSHHPLHADRAARASQRQALPHLRRPGSPLIFMINMIHTLEQPNEANITAPSADDKDSMPELDRNTSLSAQHRTNTQRETAGRRRRRSKGIDEEVERR